MLTALKMAAVLIGAMLLGNMFMGELRKLRKQGAPFHRAYFSLPGIVIIVAVLLPVLVWLARRMG